MERWHFSKALIGERVLDDVRIDVEDAYIAAISHGRGGRHVDGMAVPGFVDTHCHGGGGAEFTQDPEQVLAAHRVSGTTTMFASLVSAPVSDLCQQVRDLAPLVREGRLAGIHLEGPHLCPARCGAHDASVLHPPRPDDIDDLLRAAEGTIAMVTLAPELPGALDAIAQWRAGGVTVAIGHTSADEQVARASIDAGISVATHLCNAMPPLLHRAPGPVAVCLDDARVFVELIADGHHVAPTLASLIARCVGSRLLLVSDAMAAAGAPDGTYRLGGVDVMVRDGVARTPHCALAGSTLTLARAVQLLASWGIPPVHALRAASSNPARCHHLAQVGELAVGRRADIVVLDDHLGVTLVIAAGHLANS